MSQTSYVQPNPGPARAVLAYDGKISELYGIFLINLLLTVITLSIYRFWAITRIRRYLWSHMRFEDTRFSYTGRGKELFFGFVLAILILIGIVVGLGLVGMALARIHPGLVAIPAVIGYAGVFILFGAAHFSAQRYRLSRTEWRGIRGGMIGSALRYGVIWVLYLLLTIVTLYQAVPWMQVGLARRRIDASRFGSAVFHCDGRGGQVYLTWLATFIGYFLLFSVIVAFVVAMEWSTFVPLIAAGTKGPSPELERAITHAVPVIIGAVVVFAVGAGLLATWYYATLVRLILGTTTAVVPGAIGHDTLRFGSSVTAGGLLWLVVSNALIAIVTLGLGMPIVLHRYARYVARTTLMTGTFDAAALVQSTLARPSLGEGFLQALDPGIV